MLITVRDYRVKATVRLQTKGSFKKLLWRQRQKRHKTIVFNKKNNCPTRESSKQQHKMA